MKGKILIVDDEKLIGWSLKKDLTREDYEAHTALSMDEGLKLFDEQNPDVVLLDIRLPDGDGVELLSYIRKKDPFVSVIMITANDDVKTAVQCIKLGAYNYLHKPFDFEEVKLNIEKAVEARNVNRRLAQWESEKRGQYDFSSIVSESAQMKGVLNILHQIIDSEAATVLIEGESGTGKDLVARTIHFSGRRSSRPFISINCAAIPETLLESELFGHEKGSFTDARQSKKGLVEEASGGSLFLDEIGDMPKELQAKLLHLIDQRRFRKVGGLREIQADVRIIAATNKDLKKEVAEGRFRQDLFYRLHVIPIYLPPLRERIEDIPSLVSHFVAYYNREFRKSIQTVTPQVLEMFLSYQWPGNIRELKNVIERAMILNKGTSIEAEHVPAEIDCRCVLKSECDGKGTGQPASKRLPACLVGVPLEAIEQQCIMLTLQETGGNQSKAAKLLGIGRDALRYKMQKYGLLGGEQEAVPVSNDATVQ